MGLADCGLSCHPRAGQGTTGFDLHQCHRPITWMPAERRKRQNQDTTPTNQLNTSEYNADTLPNCQTHSIDSELHLLQNPIDLLCFGLPHCHHFPLPFALRQRRSGYPLATTPRSCLVVVRDYNSSIPLSLLGVGAR